MAREDWEEISQCLDNPFYRHWECRNCGFDMPNHPDIKHQSTNGH